MLWPIVGGSLLMIAGLVLTVSVHMICRSRASLGGKQAGNQCQIATSTPSIHCGSSSSASGGGSDGSC